MNTISTFFPILCLAACFKPMEGFSHIDNIKYLTTSLNVCIIGGERGGNKLSKEKNKDSKYIPNIPNR
jgi:hypothetical protein